MNIARTVHVGGLITAAAGILILFLVGVVTAPVPVGTIVLVVTAAVVAVAPWRWAPLLGVAVTGYLVVGFVLNDTAARLADPASTGELVGTAALAVGLAVALVAGAVAGIRGVRTRPEVVS